MLLLRLLFLFVVTARNLNGISRIGSFLFGQEDRELSADEPTRMVCSDSDDDSDGIHWLLAVSVYMWTAILTYLFLQEML